MESTSGEPPAPSAGLLTLQQRKLSPELEARVVKMAFEVRQVSHQGWAGKMIEAIYELKPELRDYWEYVRSYVSGTLLKKVKELEKRSQTSTTSTRAKEAGDESCEAGGNNNEMLRAPSACISLVDGGGADPDIMEVTDIICLDCDEGDSNIPLETNHTAGEAAVPAIANPLQHSDTAGPALDGCVIEEATVASAEMDVGDEHNAAASSQPSPLELPSNETPAGGAGGDRGNSSVRVAGSAQLGEECTPRNKLVEDGDINDRCAKAPRYPVGCSVWFHVQYSKPCAKYLLSGKGVVKSASLDRRAQKFVYEVENGHTSAAIAEEDLAFAVHCPVYVKMEDEKNLEVEGEVLLAKPAGGNNGTVVYTVLLTNNDGTIKVEEGVVPARIRYRFQLQTLQSRLRDRVTASRRQKGFGIRTNEEGKPVRNATRPAMAMKKMKRKRVPVTYAEENASSDDSDDSVSEEIDVQSAEAVMPSPTKKRKKTRAYTGTVWKKRDNHFQSTICLNGKQYYMGCYKYEAEAALAYDEGAKLLQKANCKFNFRSRKAYEGALRAEICACGQSRDVDLTASAAAVLVTAKAKVAKVLQGGGGSSKSNEGDTSQPTAEYSSPPNIKQTQEDEYHSQSPSPSADSDDHSEAVSEDESYVDSECSKEEDLQQTVPKKQKYTGVIQRKRDNIFESRIFYASTMHCLGCYRYGAAAALAYDEANKLLKKAPSKANFQCTQDYEAALRAEMKTRGQCIGEDSTASVDVVMTKVKAKLANILSGGCEPMEQAIEAEATGIEMSCNC